MKGIYKIENKINKKVYIGQAINIKRRWTIHKKDLNKNNHYNGYLQRAWNKYGEENFSFSIIEETNELNEREKFWIKSYKSFESKFGYNQTYGGTFGKLSKEARQKISDALKGEKHHLYGKKLPEETRIKISKTMSGENNPFSGRKHTKEAIKKMSEKKKGKNHPRYGKPVSAETRKKLSEIHKGIKHTDETKKKISMSKKGQIPVNKIKFTDEQIEDICSSFINKISVNSLSKKYNISCHPINRILVENNLK